MSETEDSHSYPKEIFDSSLTSATVNSMSQHSHITTNTSYTRSEHSDSSSARKCKGGDKSEDRDDKHKGTSAKDKESYTAVSSVRSVVKRLEEEELLRKKKQHEVSVRKARRSDTLPSSSGSKSKSKSKSRNNKSEMKQTQSGLKSLPWSEEDSESLQQQLVWKNCLLEDDEGLPKEAIRDLLKTIYTVLRKESISRKDSLLTEIAEKLQTLELLDLDHLVDVMAKHQKAGEAMEGQNVVLLTGAIGSGKTTTLHFLARTEFKEVEIDGFVHLHPKKWTNKTVAGYKTACGREPVTKQLQLAKIKLPNNETAMICDTPGLGSHGTSTEEELAYVYVIGPAIDKAKKVKPVVVLNNELMGSCFSNLPETLQMMTKQFDLKTGRDLRPMEYVFTHYGERHRTRLCQQFASLKNHPPPKPEGTEQLMEELIDDMIKKTTPTANIILPLDDHPDELLENIWNESFVEDPADLFHYKPSTSALKKLKWQMQITLEEFRVALSREDYAEAHTRMTMLENLSTWFIEAEETAGKAKEAASKHVSLVWGYLCQDIQDVKYEIALGRMERISEYESMFEDANECRRNGYDLIWESLVAPMEQMDFGLSFERIAKLSKLDHKYTGATAYVRRSLKLLRKKLETVVEQGDFMEAVDMIKQLHGIESETPEAGDCARHLLGSLRSYLESAIDSKDHASMMKIMRSFSAMKSLYSEADDFATRGLVLIRKSLDNAIEEGDYDTAGTLTRHMQQTEKDYDEAGEIAGYGFDFLVKSLHKFVEDRDFLKAASFMNQAIADISGTEEHVRTALNAVRSGLKGIIGGQDYRLALDIISEVDNLAKAMPEADACIEYGFNSLEENLLRSIDKQDYSQTIQLLELLSSGETQLPLAKECIRVAVEVLKRNISKALEQEKSSAALAMIKELSEKGHRLPEITDCCRHGLTMLKSTVIVSYAQDYNTIVDVLQKLSEITDCLPKELSQELNRCCHSCLQALNKASNVQDHKSILGVLRKLSKAGNCLPEELTKEVNKCDRCWLEMLRLSTEAAIASSNYITVVGTIEELSKVALNLPEEIAAEVHECCCRWLEMLRPNSESSIGPEEHDAATEITRRLSELAQSLPETSITEVVACCQRWLRTLRMSAEKAIEEKDFDAVIETIQDICEAEQNLSGSLPEEKKSSPSVFKMLTSHIDAALEKRDYETATDIIGKLSELTPSLPEAYPVTQAALQTTVDHVTELRQNAEKTVEEIRQVRDLKVFVAMLLKLKSQLDKVTKSEPLRKLSVQIHFRKDFRSKGEDAEGSKVLFVPQLYTSQAFCTDHIEQLATQVKERLPDFDVEGSMESLIRCRKVILSIMIRLKAIKKILGNCAGGEKAIDIYTESFGKFYALVESILALAEDSFKPPLDMRVFELQSWFLSVLIKGFIKDKIDVDSDERKQMEELESRRRLLILQFEVQVRDAMELLSEQEFIKERENENPDADATAPLSEQEITVEETENDGTKNLTITSEEIQSMDASRFTEPREMLVNLCQRPELFKMVLRQSTVQDLEESIRTFDVSLLEYFGLMIKQVEEGYQELLEMTKPGGGLKIIMDRASLLHTDAQKIQELINCVRGWSNDFIGETVEQQKKLQIVRKRIEIAVEKLSVAIRTESEISFASFMRDLATSFVCDGQCHEEDVPTSMI